MTKRTVHPPKSANFSKSKRIGKGLVSAPPSVSDIKLRVVLYDEQANLPVHRSTASESVSPYY